MLNPYRDWLKITSGQRSPAAHELLGVSVREQDPAVLEEAALRTGALARAYQLRYPHEASQVLNEIALALIQMLARATPARRSITVIAWTPTVVLPKQRRS